MTVKGYHNQSPAASTVRAEMRTKPNDAEVLAKRPGDEHAVTSVSVLFAHLVWLFIGPLSLLLALYGIVERRRWMGYCTGNSVFHSSLSV